MKKEQKKQFNCALPIKTIKKIRLFAKKSKIPQWKIINYAIEKMRKNAAANFQ